ncbi:MAG: AAA family ATPase [Myxococcota bacterium]|nr:AAA family ATPase [Myxococcota bacterium]
MRDFLYRDLEAIFHFESTKQTILRAEESETNRFPKADRVHRGVSKQPTRVWKTPQLPEIAEAGHGFLDKSRLKEPLVIACWSQKGGVYKTSTVHQLARIFAIGGGLKTVCVDLDQQTDLSSLWGLETVTNKDLPNPEGSSAQLDRYLESQVECAVGLLDLLRNPDLDVSSLIEMDYSLGNHLGILPASPELSIVDQELFGKIHREKFVTDKIVRPLKESGNWDVILLDLPPAWNLLNQSAIYAIGELQGTLLSPIECSITMFKSLEVFHTCLETFERDASMSIDQLFIPTRFSATAKLNREILMEYYRRYQGKIIGNPIKSSVAYEEALATNQSLLEYKPKHKLASEQREIFIELFDRLMEIQTQKSGKTQAA